MPIISEDLLAGFGGPPSPASFRQPAHVWRWSRETKQFSITLFLPEEAEPPSPQPTAPPAGLLVWKMFTYLAESGQVYWREDEHKQTVLEFLTFGPVWYAPTEILIEIISYLGTEVPIWFEGIYLREYDSRESLTGPVSAGEDEVDEAGVGCAEDEAEDADGADVRDGAADARN